MKTTAAHVAMQSKLKNANEKLHVRAMDAATSDLDRAAYPSHKRGFIMYFTLLEVLRRFRKDLRHLQVIPRHLTKRSISATFLGCAALDEFEEFMPALLGCV